MARQRQPLGVTHTTAFSLVFVADDAQQWLERLGSDENGRVVCRRF